VHAARSKRAKREKRAKIQAATVRERALSKVLLKKGSKATINLVKATRSEKQRGFQSETDDVDKFVWGQKHDDEKQKNVELRKGEKKGAWRERLTGRRSKTAGQNQSKSFLKKKGGRGKEIKSRQAPKSKPNLAFNKKNKFNESLDNGRQLGKGGEGGRRRQKKD